MPAGSILSLGLIPAAAFGALQPRWEQSGAVSPCPSASLPCQPRTEAATAMLQLCRASCSEITNALITQMEPGHHLKGLLKNKWQHNVTLASQHSINTHFMGQYVALSGRKVFNMGKWETSSCSEELV